MKKIFPLLLLSFLLSCSKVLHLSDVQLNSYQVEHSAEVLPDQEITAMIAPYKGQLDAKMNQVIGESAITMKKKKPQSTLGNWMADLIHQKSEEYYGQPIDFSIVNYGGIRLSTLQKGPVTRGKIFEIMPFDNMLVVLKVKGDIVLKLFDRMAEYGGWPISKQVRYEIDNGTPKNITIKGEAIKRDKIYKIASPDFIANGGNKCFFFREQPRDELNRLFRDAMIEFIEEETAAGKLLDAEMDFRVRGINEGED